MSVELQIPYDNCFTCNFSRFLSALAVVAEFPELIQNIILTKEVGPVMGSLTLVHELNPFIVTLEAL